MECGFVEVTVLKWEKHQRKDVKHPTWFSLSNDLVCDLDFYDFTAEEFKAWIYVLSWASKKQSKTVKLNYQHAELVSRVKKSSLDSALEKLSQLGIVAVSRDVDVTRTLRGRHADGTLQDNTLHYKTRHNNNTRSIRRTPSRPEFDFENAYREYPRHEGKSRGIRTCKVQIKTEADYQNLLEAIKNYKRMCTRERTEKKFIKHFSTFMGEWRDWIAPEPRGAPPGPWPEINVPQKPLLERIQEKQQAAK